MFRAVGIHAKEKPHSARKQSVRHAELSGVEETQIRQAGRGNTDAITGAYLSYLPAPCLYAVDRRLPKGREGLLSPPRAGDAGGGPLLKDMAGDWPVAYADGGLPPRQGRR